jgi:hypothetical protein
MLFSTPGRTSIDYPTTTTIKAAPARNRRRAFPKLRCGYGPCSQCACQAFQGSDTLCANCAHNYSYHA